MTVEAKLEDPCTVSVQMTNKNHGSYEMISTHNRSSVSDHQAFLYLCHCDDNNASVILNLQKNPPITFLPFVW